MISSGRADPCRGRDTDTKNPAPWTCTASRWELLPWGPGWALRREGQRLARGRGRGRPPAEADVCEQYQHAGEEDKVL